MARYTSSWDEPLKECARKHRLHIDKNYCPIIIDNPDWPDYGEPCGQPLNPVKE